MDKLGRRGRSLSAGLAVFLVVPATLERTEFDLEAEAEEAAEVAEAAKLGARACQ